MILKGYAIELPTHSRSKVPLRKGDLGGFQPPHGAIIDRLATIGGGESPQPPLGRGATD
jgi:hypothetical protein